MKRNIFLIQLILFNVDKIKMDFVQNKISGAFCCLIGF